MTTQTRSRFLDLRALSAVEHMRFATRQRIEGAYSGRHQSRQQGGAGEFVDFREYTGGEDLRRLDWKALGRLGKTYIRLYQEETNLFAMLVVDASESMRFGGARGNGEGSKLEYIQYLATALSHVIGRGQDQVGLAILGDAMSDYMAPGSMMSHVARLQEVLESLRTARVPRMAEGLRELFQRSRGRGVLLVLSDFLMEDLEQFFSNIRLFRHRSWEVVVLHIVHPDEERLPEGPAFRFEGMDEPGRAMCTPAVIRAAYQTRFSAHLAMVRQMALAAGCDYRRVSTAIPYMQTLGGFLVERSG